MALITQRGSNRANLNHLRLRSHRSSRVPCGDRSNAHPKDAQALAMHSMITLTMDHYTHTVVGEQATALNALPDLTTPAEQEQRGSGTDERPAATAKTAPIKSTTAPSCL